MESKFIQGRKYETIGGWDAIVVWVSVKTLKMYCIHKPDTPEESQVTAHYTDGRVFRHDNFNKPLAPVYEQPHPADLVWEPRQVSLMNDYAGNKPDWRIMAYSIRVPNKEAYKQKLNEFKADAWKKVTRLDWFCGGYPIDKSEIIKALDNMQNLPCPCGRPNHWIVHIEITDEKPKKKCPSCKGQGTFGESNSCIDCGGSGYDEQCNGVK